MKKVNMYDKQNDEEMLKIQFAAKHYYSLSATLDSYTYFLTLITEILNIVARRNIYLTIVYIIFFILTMLLIIMKGRYRNLAAKIRNIFDDKLFGFNRHEYDHEIKMYVKKAYINHGKEAQILMNNTGKDNPPGVKDWYYRRKISDKNEIIFSCQQENLFFDRNIQYYFTIISAILIGVYVASIIISHFFVGFNITMIISIIPIMQYICPKFNGFIKIRDSHIKLDGMIETTKNNILTDNLISIQEIIEKRRAFDIDIPNIIHKVKSKRIHEINEE